MEHLLYDILPSFHKGVEWIGEGRSHCFLMTVLPLDLLHDGRMVTGKTPPSR